MPLVVGPTGSMTSLERVASEAGSKLWFQVYMWPDRAASHALIERAKVAGYEALVVTVDTPVTPGREYNPRNGMTVPFRFTRRNVTDVVKALALGAKAVMIGRATFYGTAVAGEAGAARAIEIYRDEIDRLLALIGCPDISALDASYLARGDASYSGGRATRKGVSCSSARSSGLLTPRPPLFMTWV